MALTSFPSTDSFTQFSPSTLDAARHSSTLARENYPAERFLRIFCSSCSSEVGFYGVLALSVSLFKWQVTCETTTATKAPSASECLTSILLAAIARSGCSKSVISPHVVASEEADVAPLLFLWVLNSDVVYTTTTAEVKQRAMKILYQDVDTEEASRLLEPITSDVQPINMPASAISAVREVLISSSLLLPERERSFKTWKTGLLDRWNRVT